MAVDDSSSQVEAEAILAYLTEEGFCREKAVILVANKTDLVRNRTITREGLLHFRAAHACHSALFQMGKPWQIGTP